ncbi:MAG: MotA/TolQ/ExbB proton channel [Methylocystaceae bacterium]|nr:MAG: MotA/TolQ/ExbB proton channel [Methylocystaceae bacterium]TXT48496.1 MAG: MotA/TolQ/ExbB proton channel [Methylocystaceae bacterium]
MDFAPMSLSPISLAPMSPLGMFIYAGPVSKLVMALLLAAAVWTWVLIIDGVFVLRRLSKALDRVRAGGDIGVLWPIAEAAREASQAELPDETIHQKRERVLQQMNRAAREFMLDAEGGLPVLAIVASAGPFVGLFGTVWGIMSSFSGIAQTQDTSLAVVAPGIADALAATAYGLAAAIPAAIGYNRMGMAFGGLKERMIRYILTYATSIG